MWLIVIQQVSPGRVETQFLSTSFGDAGKAEEVYSKVKNMCPQDVSDAVIHALGAAPHVQVQDIIFMPMDPTPIGYMK